MTRQSREYFARVADGWDELRAGYFSDSVRDKAIALAAATEGLAVDVGAGTGFMTEGLLRAGLQVVAVDDSPEMLARAGEKLGRSERLELRIGSAEDIPVDDEEADFAFANMLLHHTESPAKAVGEMARIVRAGGKVVVTDMDQHNAVFLRTEHHDRWMGFSRGTVRRWFEGAGLEDVRVVGLEESCCATSESGEKAEVSIFAAVGTKPLTR